MKPLEHPYEQRPLRHGELIVWDSVHVAGLYVVLAQLVGPNGAWDYVVSTYYPDGSRVPGGAWTGPDRGRAQEMVDGFVEGWRQVDRIPTASEVLSRWEEKQSRAS